MVARRVSKSEFIGSGCFVQGFGLLLPPIGWWVALGPGLAIGFLLMLLLLVVGSRMSLKTVCGNCRNPLVSSDVRMCPTCHAQLQ